jgi:large conductance mechanosensitive channel
MRHMGSEFRQFILRGNVVDLAVAVVVGTAFAAVVMALVKDLITPLIAVIFGKPNFADLYFTINNSKFSYGEFINALITFLTVATAIFFFVVEPINAMTRRRRTEADSESDTRACTECLSDIPKLARRCAFCTAAQTPMPEPDTV